MCVVFSESVIRNNRWPVWRAVTTPLSFSHITLQKVTPFMHCFFYISLSLSLMQGLRTNYTLPINELTMDDCHTVQYRGVIIILWSSLTVSHHLSLQRAKKIICHGYYPRPQLRNNGYYPLRKCDKGGLSAHRLFSLSKSRGNCRHTQFSNNDRFFGV